MALMFCPECGKEISDTVKNCPHCGYRKIQKVKRQMNNEKHKMNENKETKEKSVFIEKTGIISILLVVAVKYIPLWIGRALQAILRSLGKDIIVTSYVIGGLRIVLSFVGIGLCVYGIKRNKSRIVHIVCSVLFVLSIMNGFRIFGYVNQINDMRENLFGGTSFDETEDEEYDIKTESIGYTKNELITVSDMAEIKLNDWDISRKIELKDNSYYEANSSDVVFVYAKGTYKNIDKESVDPQDVITDINVIYGDGYTYKGYVYHQNSANSTYQDIQPLTTGDIYLAAELPRSVKNEETPISISFVIDGMKYLMELRTDKSLKETSVVENANGNNEIAESNYNEDEEHDYYDYAAMALDYLYSNYYDLLDQTKNTELVQVTSFGYPKTNKKETIIVSFNYKDVNNNEMKRGTFHYYIEDINKSDPKHRLRMIGTANIEQKYLGYGDVMDRYNELKGNISDDQTKTNHYEHAAEALKVLSKEYQIDVDDILEIGYSYNDYWESIIYINYEYEQDVPWADGHIEKEKMNGSFKYSIPKDSGKEVETEIYYEPIDIKNKLDKDKVIEKYNIN